MTGADRTAIAPNSTALEREAVLIDYGVKPIVELYTVVERRSGSVGLDWIR